MDEGAMDAPPSGPEETGSRLHIRPLETEKLCSPRRSATAGGDTSMQSQCVYWLKWPDAPSPTNNYAFHVSAAIKFKKNKHKKNRESGESEEEHGGEGRRNEVEILQYRTAGSSLVFLAPAVGGVQVRDSTHELNKQHKESAKQSLASIATGPGPAAERPGGGQWRSG